MMKLIVDCSNYYLRRNIIIIFVIYFQATKFTADHVDERIEAFIDWYVNDKLKVRYSEKATKISHFVLTLLTK